VRVDPAWKRAPEMTAGELFWWDTVTRTVPVRISFQAQVTTTTSTLGLTTLFFVTREGETRLELPAIVIVNGLKVFMPVVLK